MVAQKQFPDQVVIVTGASSGIGRATALAFATAGASVVLAARDAGKLGELAATNPRLLAVPTDVTSDADVRRLVDTTLAQFGRIDILINNAGIGLRAPLASTQFADAQRVLDLNVLGVIRCTQAVLPHMQRQGRGQIVNVGSILSVLATPGHAVYSASKFAVRALSDALRIELRRSGIDVILIMPGHTDTPFFEHQIRYGGPLHVINMKGQPPAAVAAAILQACQQRRREVILTLPAKLGAWTKRCAPRLLDWALDRVLNPRRP